MKIFGKEFKVDKRKVVKGISSVVIMGAGACSSVAVKKIVKPHIPKTGNKFTDFAIGVGVASIAAVVEYKVINAYEEMTYPLIDSIFDAIEESKHQIVEGTPVEDQPPMQAVSFADPDTANYALDQIRSQLDRAGFVSLWYLLNVLDKDKVTSTISEADMVRYGWTDLESAFVMQSVNSDDEDIWNLVLPPCEEHEPVAESVTKYEEDGTVYINTNGVENAN